MKIFIDFDCTLVDTTLAACKVYNLKTLSDVKPEDISNYDMTPYINLTERERIDLFSSPLLFDYLQLFDGVEECLSILKENFDLYLITNCSSHSVALKSKWIEKSPINNLFKGKIFLDLGKGFDKSLIDMKDSILIDDHRENHLRSNAQYKYNFKRYENQSWGPLPSDNCIQFTKWDNNIVNAILKHKN